MAHSRSDYETILFALSRTPICDACYIDACDELAATFAKTNPYFNRELWDRTRDRLRAQFYPAGVTQ